MGPMVTKTVPLCGGKTWRVRFKYRPFTIATVTFKDKTKKVRTDAVLQKYSKKDKKWKDAEFTGLPRNEGTARYDFVVRCAGLTSRTLYWHRLLYFVARYKVREAKNATTWAAFEAREVPREQTALQGCGRVV